MKKIFYAATITGALLVTSCEKELNQAPISSATTETFYAIPNDFLQGVNAIYSNLKTYPDRQLNLSETRSDNLYAVSDGGVRDWEGINSFHKNLSANPYLEEAWSANYNGIYKANTVIEQLVSNGSVIPTESLRKRYEAESRFLRAFYYFDLVRWFGKVPLIDKVVSAKEALEIPRSPVEDVYALIIEDLQFSIANLPDVYPAADKGRVTKNAARGILALVHMTRSGPTYSIEGPGLGLNEWATAYGLLNDVVTSAKYSLNTSYSSIFSFTNENNSEVVFDVQYNTGSSPVVGATFPWLLAPDNWFTSLGKPVQGGLTIRPIATDLLNSYEIGDTRRAFSIQDGFVVGSVVESRSFFKKYVDLTKVPANRLDWPINFIVLRYTDILLLRAECVIKGGGGNVANDVIAPVNLVRARAGLAAISTLTLDQLMEERRKEFAAEGSRWHDLVRSGLVITKIPSWITAEDVQGQMQAFVKEYVIYAIPQSQLDVKSGLYTQNAGYN